MFGTLTCRFVQAFCCLAVAGAEPATREPSLRLLDETEVATRDQSLKNNWVTNRPMREHDVGIWKSFVDPGDEFQQTNQVHLLIPVLAICHSERCCATCRTLEISEGNWGPFFFLNWKFMEKKQEKTTFLTNGGVERNGYRLQKFFFWPPQKAMWFFVDWPQKCSKQKRPNRSLAADSWIPGLPRIGQNALKADQLWRRVIWKPSCGAVFITICGMNEKYRSNLVQIHSIHAWNGVFDSVN